jgi:hypothetical protein
MGRACSTNGEIMYAYRMLVEKTDVKRPLGRARHRWVNNMKINLRAIGWGGMGGFSRRARLHKVS